MRVCGISRRVAIVLAAWSAPAAGFTGAELSDLCFRKGLDGELACASYVRGFADGLAFEEFVPGAGTYCPPSTLQVKDIRQIVEQYLRGHSGQLDKEAGALVGLALHQAFPCRRSP